MEYMIENWLDFANQVETGVAQIEQGYSDSYLNEILNLIANIRSESANLTHMLDGEKEACFLRINKMGTELKNVACFVGA